MKQLAVFSVSGCISLAFVLAWSLTRPPKALNPVAYLSDPRFKAEVIQELVATSQNVFDSHSDPDVGRVLQPWLDGREFGGVAIRSNQQGMRERPYVLPKPPGLVRVVLLGDSFAFGEGLPEDQRVSNQLERMLGERASRAPQGIEVLSLAVASWDILAACSYVRRQLTELQPDLVVHVTCSNDLDDTEGVRGFGSRSRFSPRHRERADARLAYANPEWDLGHKGTNCLHLGLDWESVTRYSERGDAIVALSTALERRGARYVLLSHWASLSWLVKRHWASRLAPEQAAFLPGSFYVDPAVRLGPDDAHWNTVGSERVARFVYGMILEHDLLSEIGLADWPEARAEFRALDGAGREEAEQEIPDEGLQTAHALSYEVNCKRMSAQDALQIHGGIDKNGLVSPYASILLSNRELLGKQLRVEGVCLERPELDGGRVQVWADEHLLGEITLASKQLIVESFDLPAEVAARRFLSARFIASDWGYSDPDLQHCVVFRLIRVTFDK